MSLTEQTYNYVKRQIVSLALAPGSVIDEATLRVELGVGRTPIREALQRLERDKLVVIYPRRGTFVTEVNPSDLLLLYDSRVVLEAYIARLAAIRGTETDWAQMEQVLSDALALGTTATIDQLVEADRQCHEIMYAAANHKFLTDTLVMLYAQSDRLWHVYMPNINSMKRAMTEHQEMLQALRQRDGTKAAILMEAHISHLRQEIQALMIEQLLV